MTYSVRKYVIIKIKQYPLNKGVWDLGVFHYIQSGIFRIIVLFYIAVYARLEREVRSTHSHCRPFTTKIQVLVNFTWSDIHYTCVFLRLPLSFCCKFYVYQCFFFNIYLKNFTLKDCFFSTNLYKNVCKGTMTPEKKLKKYIYILNRENSR